MKIRKISLFLLLLLALQAITYAHFPQQSYIYLQILEDSIKGRYEVTTKDLNKVFDLDLKPGLTKEDLAPHLKKIQDYFLNNTQFSSQKFGKYEVNFTKPSFLRASGFGDFVELNFDLKGVNEIPDKIDVKYEAIIKDVPGHTALLVIEQNWKAGIFNNESIHSLEFSLNNADQELSITEGSLFQGFVTMIKSGIWHIWIGFDHILFLLALLLPSVLSYRSKHDRSLDESESGFWKPTEKFKPALINVVKIVTCFTIAHTLTLSLAALNIISLPSRLVESIIAISIALAAIHNIRPLVVGKEWLIAFGFGLFHGFGFAGVLAEKGLGGDYLVLSLFGFNLGVEIGQMAIILLVFPTLFLLRKTFLYSNILLFGSILLIFASLYWFTERVFNIDLPLGGYIVQTLRTLGIL